MDSPRLRDLDYILKSSKKTQCLMNTLYVSYLIFSFCRCRRPLVRRQAEEWDRALFNFMPSLQKERDYQVNNQAPQDPHLLAAYCPMKPLIRLSVGRMVFQSVITIFEIAGKL